MSSQCGTAVLQGCPVRSFGILTLPVGLVLLQKPQSWQGAPKCDIAYYPKKTSPKPKEL